jgi:hypothetical protein
MHWRSAEPHGEYGVDHRFCASIGVARPIPENVGSIVMHILWVIIIGFLAGIIACFFGSLPASS